MKKGIPTTFLKIDFALKCSQTKEYKFEPKAANAEISTILSFNEVQQTFFTTSLSGYYFEKFESDFLSIDWQVVDVSDPTGGYIATFSKAEGDTYDGVIDPLNRCCFAPTSPLWRGIWGEV